MINYIIRRLLYTIPILLGVALVFFFIFNVVGGSEKVIYNIVSAKARTAKDIEFAKHQLGLDKPLYAQYFDYIKQIATMDFGRSLSTKQDIGYLIKKHVPNSAKLAFPAFFLEMLVSLILSLFCAFYRGTIIDKGISVIATALMSFSALALIIILQNLLAYKWGLFPIAGWAKGIKAIKYLGLPVLLWVIVSIGSDVRFFRTVFIEEVNKDYVRTARAKGLSNSKIMFTHVLKNAMIPFLTYTVMAIPFLLVGSFIIERFFTIPGIGFLTVAAVSAFDLPVLKATVIIYSLFFIVFNLITDILYAVVDPRVRLG